MSTRETLTGAELEEIAAGYRSALRGWLTHTLAKDVAAQLAEAFGEHCDMPVVQALGDVCRLVHGARDRARRKSLPEPSAQQLETGAMACWRVLTTYSYMRERWGYRPGTYSSFSLSAMRGERGAA